MGLFDRIKSEVRNAGEAARGAIDEGRLRIEIFRVRQQADAAAQSLGYAVHRARRDGRELDQATIDRLDGVLVQREADAARLETELARSRSGAPAAEAQPGKPAEKPPEKPPGQPTSDADEVTPKGL